MNLVYVTHPDYLRVTVDGEFSLTDASTCITEIYRLCEEHNYLKVLVDSRGIPGQISLSSRYSMAEHIAAGYPRPIRFAMLCSTEQVTFTKLLENAANNRGALLLTTDVDADAFAYLGIR